MGLPAFRKKAKDLQYLALIVIPGEKLFRRIQLIPCIVPSVHRLSEYKSRRYVKKVRQDVKVIFVRFRFSKLPFTDLRLLNIKNLR